MRVSVRIDWRADGSLQMEGASTSRRMIRLVNVMHKPKKPDQPHKAVGQYVPGGSDSGSYQQEVEQRERRLLKRERREQSTRDLQDDLMDS